VPSVLRHWRHLHGGKFRQVSISLFHRTSIFNFHMRLYVILDSASSIDSLLFARIPTFLHIWLFIWTCAFSCRSFRKIELSSTFVFSNTNVIICTFLVKVLQHTNVIQNTVILLRTQQLEICSQKDFENKVSMNISMCSCHSNNYKLSIADDILISVGYYMLLM
jgi:hypothetical protein